MNAPRKPRPAAPTARPLPSLETLAAAAALGALGVATGGCHGPAADATQTGAPGAEQHASILDVTRWFTGPGIATSTTPQGQGVAPCNYVPPGTTGVNPATRVVTGTGPVVPIAPAGAPVAITPIPPVTSTRIVSGGARAFTPHPPSSTTPPPHPRTHR